MKIILCLVAFVFISVEAKKFNIIFISIDDLNTKIGAYEFAAAHTPNIDSLIKSGVQFNNAHISFAACAPSRASMISGLRSDELRIWDFRKPYFRNRNPNVVTFPGALRQGGYTTVGIGKILDARVHDIGDGAPEICKNKQMEKCSWDRYFTVTNIFDNGKKLCDAEVRHFPGLNSINDRRAFMVHLTDEANEQNHLDSCITRLAIKQVKSLVEAGKPFMIAVGWILPHLPWVIPESVYSRYKQLNESIADDIRGGNPNFWTQESSAASRYGNGELNSYSGSSEVSEVDRIKGYLASITFIDKQLGLFLDAVRSISEKLLNDSLIVFWSDHGFHLGDNELWGKWTLFEEATRVPFAIIPPKEGLLKNFKSIGKSVNAPVEAIDIYPTILDMCSIDVPQKISGTSLVPLMHDHTSYVRAAAISQMWAHDRWQGSMGYAIRTMEHRLIIYTSDFDKEERKKKILPFSSLRRIRIAELELYDYSIDGSFEKVNRIGMEDYANITEELLGLWYNRDGRGWDNLIGRAPPDYDFQSYQSSQNYTFTNESTTNENVITIDNNRTNSTIPCNSSPNKNVTKDCSICSAPDLDKLTQFLAYWRQNCSTCEPITIDDFVFNGTSIALWEENSTYLHLLTSDICSEDLLEFVQLSMEKGFPEFAINISCIGVGLHYNSSGCLSEIIVSIGDSIPLVGSVETAPPGGSISANPTSHITAAPTIRNGLSDVPSQSPLSHYPTVEGQRENEERDNAINNPLIFIFVLIMLLTLLIVVVFIYSTIYRKQFQDKSKMGIPLYSKLQNYCCVSRDLPLSRGYDFANIQRAVNGNLRQGCSYLSKTLIRRGQGSTSNSHIQSSAESSESKSSNQKPELKKRQGLVAKGFKGISLKMDKLSRVVSEESKCYVEKKEELEKQNVKMKEENCSTRGNVISTNQDNSQCQYQKPSEPSFQDNKLVNS